MYRARHCLDVRFPLKHVSEICGFTIDKPSTEMEQTSNSKTETSKNMENGEWRMDRRSTYGWHLDARVRHRRVVRGSSSRAAAEQQRQWQSTLRDTDTDFTSSGAEFNNECSNHATRQTDWCLRDCKHQEGGDELEIETSR